MTIYNCTVIYGWHEGDLKVWDEVDIEIVDVPSESRRDKPGGIDSFNHYLKERAVEEFQNTIGRALSGGGYAFAFVDYIEEGENDD